MINKTEYEPDLEVLNRYQSYSTEVARLATSTLIGFGVILSFGFKDGNTTPLLAKLAEAKHYLFFSLILLGASIGCSLLHRYYSTDVLASLILKLRLEKMGNATRLESEVKNLRNSLNRSTWMINLASVLFAVGAPLLLYIAVEAIAGSTATKPALIIYLPD